MMKILNRVKDPPDFRKRRHVANAPNFLPRVGQVGNGRCRPKKGMISPRPRPAREIENFAAAFAKHSPLRLLESGGIKVSSLSEPVRRVNTKLTGVSLRKGALASFFSCKEKGNLVGSLLLLWWE
jgi:hypothetical protein